ncbi:AAA family ATPase [Enterococcus faecalis]|uniref:AAA family ATPase n=1 Tax=Enterococcus faecalis TaxID=1351 RepID=UPI0022DEAEB4|nr:AAA family ATPase [Enterococcus faecalis]
MEIKKAKREKIKVPIMITGASGSGKTVSALFIAKGIIEKMHSDLSEQEQWEKIGVIDTEHKRSLLYADSTIGNVDIGEFLHIDFEAPFTVQRYIQAFNLFKQAGVEVVIVDSLTHAWSGEGGILEQVENHQRGNSKNQMLAWNKVKPLEKEFLKLVTGNSMYVIGTSRSKQAYDMEKMNKVKHK